MTLLWFVACLNYLDRLILITMRTSIKDSIPMTEAQFGLLTTVFLVTYGVLSPFCGFLADKLNRSRVIIFSLFAWSARRLPLSAMGFLQFITPTMTFVLGLLQGERFTPLRGVSFALIWTAVAVFALSAWRRSRPAAALLAKAAE